MNVGLETGLRKYLTGKKCEKKCFKLTSPKHLFKTSFDYRSGALRAGQAVGCSLLLKVKFNKTHRQHRVRGFAVH